MKSTRGREVSLISTTAPDAPQTIHLKNIIDNADRNAVKSLVFRLKRRIDRGVLRGVLSIDKTIRTRKISSMELLSTLMKVPNFFVALQEQPDGRNEG